MPINHAIWRVGDTSSKTTLPKTEQELKEAIHV